MVCTRVGGVNAAPHPSSTDLAPAALQLPKPPLRIHEPAHRSCECDHRHVPCCILRPPTLTTVLHHLHSPVTPASEQEQTDGVSRCRQEDGQVRTRVRLRGTEPGSVAVQRHAQGPDTSGQRQRGDGGARDRRRAAPGQGGRRGRVGRGGRRRAPRHQDRRRRAAAGRRRPAVRPHRRTGWHAGREDDAGRQGGAHGAAEGACGGGQGVRRHWRRHGAGAGAARPHRGQHEGDDVRVQGGPAQRVREQGGGGREPGHEREHRDGHGVRAGRRGEAARPRGGAGGGGSPALRLTITGPATTYGV
uniref:Uncharacterized protein n=1 Tax=Zea mays TaxID=4577 RepID=A0A804MXV7_MAIZE